MPAIVVFFILLFAASANAEVRITETLLLEINDEVTEAFINKDIAPLEQYVFDGSEIIIDLDPDPAAGQRTISYENWRELIRMSLQMLDEVSVNEEVLAVEINKNANQGTLTVKSDATMTMMGNKIRDVSINATTYGVINGQVRVLRTEDKLISSEALN